MFMMERKPSREIYLHRRERRDCQNDHGREESAIWCTDGRVSLQMGTWMVHTGEKAKKSLWMKMVAGGCGDRIQGRRRVLVIASVFSVIWEPSSETDQGTVGGGEGAGRKGVGEREGEGLFLWFEEKEDVKVTYIFEPQLQWGQEFINCTDFERVGHIESKAKVQKLVVAIIRSTHQLVYLLLSKILTIGIMWCLFLWCLPKKV